MNINKLIEILEEARDLRGDDLEVVIKKDEPSQLSGNTVINIEDAYLGFDWENDYLVLLPQLKILEVEKIKSLKDLKKNKKRWKQWEQYLQKEK